LGGDRSEEAQYDDYTAPDQERAIEEAVRIGAFRSVDEFIGAAIAALPNHTLAAEPARTPPRKSRLWELREGLTLGELSIKDLIEEGRE
jgi:Arc/MetJ-type ribon-helix-helix transcriptional regulator